jgi:peptide/nickel transport system permease protein
MMTNVADAARSIVPEPERFATLRRVLFGRPSTIFALLIIAVFVIVAVFAPWIAPYDPLAQSYLKINQAPSTSNWLGTDQFGRDVLSRIIYGSRNSLILGLTSPVLAAAAGTAIGVLAGFFGGWTDRILSRLVDTLLAFPELLLAIMIASALGGGFWKVVIIIAVAYTPGFARVARAATLAVIKEPYVESAVSVGVRTPVIIVRHIVPNISSPLIVLLTLWAASAIRLEATLSFLGIGTQPPNPSWGNIIRDGLNNLFGSPWPILGAGVALTLVVLALNLIGDAIRDVLDPDISE